MKLSVIIPVYNEVQTIQEIIERVKQVRFEKEIIVVDDGSTDGTRDLLKQQGEGGVTILFHESNQGKGAAIRTAITHISGDIAIIQDADLEYHPSEYARLIAPIRGGKGRCRLWLPIPWGTSSGPLLLACRRKQDSYKLIQYADELKPDRYGDWL